MNNKHIAAGVALGIAAGVVIAVLLFSYGIVNAATILFPGGGGTGWGNPGGLQAHSVIIGNGLAPVSTTTPGTAGWVLTSNGAAADPTFQAATGGGSGTVTQINTTWPIIGGPITTTGTLTFGGLSTTSQPIAGQMLYSNGTNGLTPVSTTSLTVSGPFQVPTTLGALVGGAGAITWDGLATTSQPVSSNLLTSNGAAGVYGTATSTLTASSPLTGSFTQVGSGGSLGCQGASGSQAGCLSAADWTTFNLKQIAGFQISTTSSVGISKVAYYTSATPTTLGGVATTSVTAGTGLTGTLTTLGSADAVALANTAVTPAAYTCTNLTVDQQGRLTAASNGSCGGGSNFWSTIGTNIANNTGINVGIGTSTPAASLTVDSTTTSPTEPSFIVASNGNTEMSVSSSSATFLGIATTSPYGQVSIQALGAGGNAPSFVISSTSNARLIVDQNGNVGVGTSTPTRNANAIFVVDGGIESKNGLSVMGGGSVNTPDVVTGFTMDGLTQVTSANAAVNTLALQFTTRKTVAGGAYEFDYRNTGGSTLEAFNVMNLSGFSGWGTTTPANASITIATSSMPQLILNTGIAASPPWYERATGQGFYIGTTTQTLGYATSTVPAFMIAPLAGAVAGQVGISTTTPIATLSDGGTFSAVLTAFATGDSAVCQRGAGGLFTIDSGVSSCIVSSQFVKHDIANTTDSDALSRVMAINPVSFVYNDDGASALGFTAEQLNSVDSRYAQHTGTEQTRDGHVFKIGDSIAPDTNAVLADVVKVVQSQQQILASVGKTAARDAEENWQWGAILLLVLWNLYLTYRRRS